MPDHDERTRLLTKLIALLRSGERPTAVLRTMRKDFLNREDDLEYTEAQAGALINMLYEILDRQFRATESVVPPEMIALRQVFKNEMDGYLVQRGIKPEALRS